MKSTDPVEAAFLQLKDLRGARFAYTLANVSNVLGLKRQIWRGKIRSFGSALGDLRHPFIDLDDERLADLFVSVCREMSVPNLLALFVMLFDVGEDEASACASHKGGNSFLRNIVKRGISRLIEEMLSVGGGTLLHVSDDFLRESAYLSQYCEPEDVSGFYRILTPDGLTSYVLYGTSHMMVSGTLGSDVADRIVRLFRSGLFDTGEVQGVHRLVYPKALGGGKTRNGGTRKKPHLRRPHVRHLRNKSVLIPWTGVHLRLGNFGVEASLRYADRHGLLFTEVLHE